MKKDIKKKSFEKDLKILLSNYKKEEIDYYKEIIEEVNNYKSKFVETHHTVLQENNSNG